MKFGINIEHISDIYRVFQKKVPAFVLPISRLPKHLENRFCTFFNSPVFAESKNNHILILGLKLEKLLTKMLWEYYIWNDEYWGFNQFDDELLFLHFFGFQDTLKRGFYTIFNSPRCAESKNNKICILKLELVKAIPKVHIGITFVQIECNLVIKIVQNYLSRCLRSWEVGKTKWRINLIETSLFLILNMVFSLHFCLWFFKF